MNKKPIYFQKYMAIAVLLLASSCSKIERESEQPAVTFKAITKMSGTTPTSYAYGDTILNINYESGTLNSGITGLTATNATAADAAYILSPGATGNYAIAHKVTYGDSTYYSDGNWRSEAASNNVPSSCYLPGEERRYEFSVLLKDWTAWNTGDPINETNIFQLKMSGGEAVPLQIRTQRNAMRVVYGNMDNTKTVVDILNDIRPSVNQWIHFRVDVKWATTATGSMKIYMKLPGQTDFTLANERNNAITFTGDVGSGNVGYVKWGVYVVPPNLTRIVYHDDLRIINLNYPPASTGLIWGNSIPDANPAYLDGAYTKAGDASLPSNYNNTSNVYQHPYIKYLAPQNIVYVNSTSPAPNPADNVVGTPWSDFSRTTLAASGMSGSTPGPSGRYLLGGWANASSASTPTALDLTEYYEFRLEPKSGYYFNFGDIKFTVLRGSTTHPNKFVLRSSVDNYASNISAPVSISGTTTPTLISFNAAALTNINTPVTFRLYAYGATATSGNLLVGLNDFQVNGQVLPLP
ncbi:hypothetical protein D3C87_1074210 [compost metagenome]|uniref:heparin lyase I family protein n=1 Tax=Pedobacter ghigonis TaxID=2730403 RepID=UPI000FB2348E|nr:heparin lyase I family protein [Pedobacter ghigonis]